MAFGARRTAALLVVGAVVVSSLVGLGMGGSAGRAVEIEAVALREIRPSVFASGRIMHGNEVSLTSEVIGKVKAIHVVEGQTVQRGDLVLVIDDEAYLAQVAQNRAAVRLREIDIERSQLAIANLRRQHDRNRRLFERGLLDEHAFEGSAHRLRTAEIDLDSARQVLAQAAATLAQSEEHLNKTRIRSPISGVVTSLDIEVGETAIASTTNIPGSGLMVIADPASLLTEVYVDEADVSHIRIGQQAEVVAIAYPEQPLTGTVEFIANTAKHQPDRRGLSFRIRMRLADAVQQDFRLRPGMSCRAEIFMASGFEVPAVPLRALVSEDDLILGAVNHFVYVVRGEEGDPSLALDAEWTGAVRKAALEVGRSDDEFQEIRSGVAVGDWVVVGPGRTLRYLADGDSVAAIDAAEPAAP